MRTTSPILSEGREIRPLTGVRGMAAGLVLWRHFSGLWVPLLPLLGWFSSLALNGQIGVDLFFVLSGFILAYVHESDQVQFNKRSHLKFLWLRLARVYPIHLAVLGLFAVFAFWGNLFAGEHLGSYPLTSLPFQLTMTHAWIVVHTYQWNYPSWSISAEWFAYLLMFPVSVWILKRKLPAANLFLIGYALLCGWVVLLISHRGEEFWRYGAVIRVGLEFLAGSAFYGVFQQRSPIIRFCQKWCTPIICSWLLLLVATRPGYAHWF